MLAFLCYEVMNINLLSEFSMLMFEDNIHLKTISHLLLEEWETESETSENYLLEHIQHG